MRANALSLLAASAALTALIGLSACTNGPTPTSSSDATAPDTDVAATVNGTEIKVADIDLMIDRQLTDRNGNKAVLQPAELAAARMQALQQLIQEEALYQRAKKDGVVPTPEEVQNEIQSQKQQQGMTEEQFQNYLKASGQTEDKFKEQATRQLAIKKLQDKIAVKVQTPTEDELKKAFEQNKAQLVAQRGVDLSDIIVDPRPNGAADDATTPEAAQKKAQDIYASLKGGADFATVARARSEDPNTIQQAGSVGFLSDDQLKQTFPEAIVSRFYSMQPGQYTEPIQGGSGQWHIFKVNNIRQQTQPLTYEQVSQQLAQQIIDQRKQVVISALYIDALSTATVKNYIAERIIEHPDNFGVLRPSPLTQPRSDNSNANAGAPAPTAPTAPAAPAAGSGTPTTNANTNAK